MFQNLKILFVFIVFSLAGFCLSAQYSKKTLQQFDKALQQYKLSEYENAELTINSILKKNPDFIDAILLLADVYQSTGQTKSETETLEKALNYAQNPLIYLRLGKAYFSLAEYR